MKRLFVVTILFILCSCLNISAQTNTTAPKTDGYMGIVEASFGLTLGDQKDVNRLNITMINGYKFSPWVYLGAGVGLSYYTMHSEVSIPLFIYLKANFTDTKVSPFISMSVGSNIATQANACIKGLSLEPAVGIDFDLGSKNRIFFSTGLAVYNIEYINITFGSGSYTPSLGKRSELVKAINFKLGFVF